ncbi:TPA: hypothetical protein ACJ2WV_004521 [Kluyvera georgiana]
MTSREQLAAENGMSVEYVNWFFDHKKEGCGNVWFMMMAAMWEGWQAASKASEQQLAALAANNAMLKDALLEEGYRYFDAETKVTDAYLAEVRASEAKHVYDSILDNPAVTDMESLVDWLEQYAKDSASFAAQLRQGEKS